MAAQTETVTKVVVKNLPASWSSDYLLNFLEVVTSLLVADNGIQVFRGITHTVLLTLEKPVPESFLKEGEQRLAQMAFKGMILELIKVASDTCSLLVSFSDPSLTHDHLFYYFDNPTRSGCGDADVTYCEMYLELCIAVVHFSLPEAVGGVIAKGNHVPKKDGEILKIEPWYDQFHRPLLEQLLTGTRPKVKPPTVPPKPQVPPPQPISSYTSEIEALRTKMEVLRLENQHLKFTKAEKMQKRKTSCTTKRKMRD